MKVKYPEVGDLVVVSIREVKGFGAKGDLVEYEGIDGFIHIAEIATGWVKHIRDHLREGQNTVCKVLNVDKTRNHADLSLKRVNQHQKREKIAEWKNEQKAEKLLEIVASSLSISVEQAESDFASDLRERYGVLYAAFEDASASEEWLPEVEGKWKDAFTKVAKDNVVIPFVSIGGTLELYSLMSDGVERIVSCLEGVEEEDVKLRYAGAPVYRITVKEENYKKAEELLKAKVDRILAEAKKQNVFAEFSRT